MVDESLAIIGRNFILVGYQPAIMPYGLGTRGTRGEILFLRLLVELDGESL